MIIDDIQLLIQKGEGLKIEFKEARDAVPASFYETVVAFANTDGGTLLLGINDDGLVTGINPGAEKKLQKDIITALHSRDCINPPMYVQPYVLTHPQGEIMVVQIPASSQVHDHAGRIYIREFESDLDITAYQHKISELYLRKRNFFTEAQIIPHLSMDDMNPALFDMARQLIRNYRSDHPWLLVNDEQMLKDAVLWRKDFMTGQEGFTLAAALVFGKDETIQSILPAYKVEAMVRIKNTDRWDDRLNPPLRTNLINTYLVLKNFVNDHLPDKFYMEGDQRIDLRDKIFREVIGNAIVHREYTSAFATELIISATDFTITNPNKPLFHGPIDPHGFNPYPKNPNIRKFFTAFGWTDEIGSGIRNTNKYLPLYIGGGKPLFLENDIFKTVIPLKWGAMGHFANEWCQWLELPRECLTHLQSGLNKVSLQPELSEAGWQHVLLHLVPSWYHAGAKETGLKWVDSQAIIKSEIEKVPSWDQKGTMLLTKRNYYLTTILMLTGMPLKREEMMGWIGYENRKSFSDLYLQPLLKTQLIKRTNEQNPKDPNQKYYLSEKGIAFLNGTL